MSAFTAIDVGGKHSDTCECGAPKTKGAHGCERCMYLDGRRPAESAVIAALRIASPLTTQDLCVMVYGQHTESNATSMLRMLHQLLARGRVSRHDIGRDGQESTALQRGHEVRKIGGHGLRYAYQLTERGRA